MTIQKTIRHTNSGRRILLFAASMILVTTGLTQSLFSFQNAQSQSGTTPKGPPKMQKIRGEFTVKMIPAESVSPSVGEFRLDKTYHGALTATGQGKMLTGMTDTKDSAAYVAIEQIDGTLDGKKGSFLICHRGFMKRGEKELQIRIVSDSGKGELSGIHGTMSIDIRDGKHFYEFEYSLEPQP